MISSSSSASTGSSQESSSPAHSLYPRTSSCISSNLQVIPYHKLVDLKFINKGAYGTVHSALHSDWRTRVAVKFFPTERHLVDRERNKILKEAEILHKARFSFILPILGICNEEENIGIVTEYMQSGSLNQLLHEDNPFPVIAWPLRIRMLYEIALGVNFLHNMTPPLLHHDLKTPNILLDSEFHVKIADFGLSKWRMLSQSLSDQNPPGGTIVYMPPELYEPEKNSRGNVKHDMYSYAIIMWEVLSRKQPYEGAKNPMQIMFSVAKGNRPDTSEDSLPADIPHRNLFVSIMQSGWASDPNDRPAFLKCLLDIEPVMREYDNILMLEAILEIIKSRNNISSTSVPSQPIQESLSPVKHSQSSISNSSLNHASVFDTSSSSEDEEIVTWETSQKHKPICSHSCLHPEQSSTTSLLWVQQKRDQIVKQMTEACLNQSLDALISNMMIFKEDYELIKSQCTRSERVRKLIDTCELIGEHFAKVIVQKLKDNRQNGLQPFP